MRYLILLPLFVLACPGGKEEADEGLDRVELGTFTTDTGFGANIEVDVPEEAVSSLVACGPYGYDTLATVETLTDPGGTVAYDMTDPQAGGFRIGIQDDYLPALLPVSPDLDIVAGTWTWRVFVDTAEAATVSCSVLFRTQEVAAAQTVDLQFIFVGVEAETGLNATTGLENSLAATALESVDSLWSPAGLSVGTLSYEDFGGDVDRYNSVDGAQELGELLRTANPSSDRIVPIFLVSAITDEDGANILGVSAGPPGAAATGGTSKSGVVIEVGAIVDGDVDLLARVIAHEVLHFLGLFHPVSKDGTETDPLGDTPTCTNDANGDSVLSTDECGGSGAENLMWWAASDASTQLSNDQGWVVARSAVAK